MADTCPTCTSNNRGQLIYPCNGIGTANDWHDTIPACLCDREHAEAWHQQGCPRWDADADHTFAPAAPTDDAVDEEALLWCSAEALARDFHEAYERLAPAFGYKTREATAVRWEDVHGANRDLMVATASEMYATLAAALTDRTAAIAAARAAGREEQRALDAEARDEVVARLASSIVWALGAGEDFPPREDGDGAYWWRKELSKRAGAVWNRDTLTYDFATQPTTEEA